MINNDFWRAAASAWSWDAKPDIKVTLGSGGKIDDSLLKKPWEMLEKEFVDFDDIDYETSTQTVLENGNVVLKEQEAVEEEVSHRISLDMDKFDDYMEQESVAGYIHCFKLLRDCGLPESVTDKLKEMVSRMVTLEDSANKFRKVYEADLSMFIENYIPETLNLAVGYIEYINAKVSEEILFSTQREIEEAMDTLLIGVNEKIDEIHKFASIELKAAAKALNATMNSEGYVDTKYKL